jgi:DNA repair protein RadC
MSANGGVSALGTTPVELLARARGMGEAKAASLVAAFELGRRAALAPAARPVVRDAADVAAVARPYLREPAREECLVVVDRHSPWSTRIRPGASLRAPRTGVPRGES